MSRAVVLLAAALLAGSAAALYQAETPLTVQWDRGIGLGYNYNADTSLYPFARVVTGNTPDQVNLVYQSPSSVVVSWVVGDGQQYNDSVMLKRPSLTGVQSIVKYAPKGSMKESTATGFSQTYEQNHPAQDPINGTSYNYTSGIINHVALTDLTPGTEYYYKVGDGRNWSLPFEFTTLQPVSNSFAPYRIGVLADLGITDNSTVTLEHLTEALPDVVLLIGDLNYANNLYTNGTIEPKGYSGPSQTYQPVWDQFYRWWSTLTARVPYLAVAGNHETETQTDGSKFVAYNARFNMTSDLSKSGNSRYYSVDLPGVHLIALAPYDPYNTSTPQYQWLQQDLKSFNRSKTPFLVVMEHPPIYNTYVSHYKEVECARLAWEQLFFQYGVDLVMAGHVHSYERTNRVYNYQPNPCGPVYVTIGDGGNLEMLAVPHADEPGNCPAIKYGDPGSQFTGNCMWNSFQSENANTTNGGYCPTSQPAWSAYREPSFGHATLDVTPTAMTWAWHRNQDAEPVTADAHTIVPKDSSCPNAAGPAATAPALAPSLPVLPGVSG